MGKQAKDEGRRDLIGRVGNANVEIGQVSFDKVANDNVEFSLFGSGMNQCWMACDGREKECRYALSLDTLRDFCCHPRVHLYSGDMFGFFKNSDRQISSAGTNLQDFVRGTKIRLERRQLGNAFLCVSGAPCLQFLCERMKKKV